MIGSTAGLGDVALAEGDLSRARGYYAAALTSATEPRLFAYLFAGIAAVTAASGRKTEAARLWGAAEYLESELDQGIDTVARSRYELVIGDIDPEEVEAGRALSREEALELAREMASAKVSPASGS